MLDAWFSKPATIAPVTRSAAAQAAVDAATAELALYHYDSCMYCARVRKAIAALGLDIELRDVLAEPRHRADLVRYGGRSTVPCLCIAKATPAQARWLYESAAIVAYLVDRFGAPG